MEKKRVYRSKDERIAAVDVKIAYHHKCIEALEEKKQSIMAPRAKSSRTGVSTVTRELKEKNVDPKKALEALKEAGLI